MRGWWRAAAAAADEASARPGLWLPGALAWTITVGWIPLLLVVAEPPSVADLTFLGANLYTSGAWPWNAIVAGIGLLAVATTAFVFVALAESILAGGGRRLPTIGQVSRAARIGVLAAAPALAALLAGATAFVIVAMDEFTSPGEADPLIRSLVRVVPFLAVVVVAWAGGALLHAAALREVIWRDAGIGAAVSSVPGTLRRGGRSVVVAAVAMHLVRLAYLGAVGLLLWVLWASLAERLAAGGMGAALAPLLVGFVAIWLCLVLAGGALHAWGSLTWSRVLGERPEHAERSQ